ncbi:hypothetical protein NC651_025995 [Populus alba x Populus x berolinensis]|nr:hypothetical protein NC651_025995 [Populus alba x Populus x berolinensis]
MPPSNRSLPHPWPYKVRRAAEREEDGRSMLEDENQSIDWPEVVTQGCLLLSWCITASSINYYVDDRRVDLKTHSFF